MTSVPPLSRRTWIIARSIIFGSVVKMAGGLTVFIGLPAVAASASATDYVWFVAAIGISALMTIPFGAAGVTVVREAAYGAMGVSPLSVTTRRRSMGFFVIVSVGALVLGAVLGASTPALATHPWLIACVVGLVCIQGLFSWAEHYRVGTRTEYWSNLSQLIVNITLIVLIMPAASAGLPAVVVVYFGLPAIASVVLFAFIPRSMKLGLEYEKQDIVDRTRKAIPIVATSAVEYTKVFVAPALAGVFAAAGEYAKTATIVLLVSRLANPASLLTRPLLPAIIDALRTDDRGWLLGLRRSIGAVGAVSLVAAVGAGVAIPSAAFAAAFPTLLQDLTRLEVLAMAMMLWGYIGTALLAPVLLAMHLDRVFALVNGVWIGLGLVAGCVGYLSGIGSSMIYALAAAAMGSAVSLFVIVLERIRHVETG